MAWFLALALVGTATVRGQDKLESGKELLKSGKPAEAILVLRSVTLVDAKYPNAMVLLARAYMAVGKSDSAEWAVKNALDKNAKNTEALILLTDVYLSQKKSPEAYAVLRKGLKSMKNNAALLTHRGFVHMRHDSTDKAIVDFSLAKEMDPKYAPAYEGLGDVYVKFKGYAIAIMNYEEAVKLDSTKEELLYKLSQSLKTERRYTEAARVYNRILDLHQENDTVRLELGNLYHAATQYPNAARVLATYVQKNPADTSAWRVFVDAVDNGKWAGAEIGYQTAEAILKTQPKLVKAMRLAGKSGYTIRKYGESAGQYRTIEKLEPLNAEDYKYMGKSLLNLKKDSLAAALMEKSLAKDTTQTDLYVDLGSAYMNMKKWAKAADMFEKKMNLDTTRVDAAYINYALCKEQLGDWESAKNVLLKAVGKNPKYINGFYHLGICYSQLKMVPDAKKSYETVIQLVDTAKTRYRKELADSYKYIALTHLSDRKWNEALEFLNKAIELDPKDINLLIYRAQTFAAMSRKDEARKEFERVLRIDPKNPDAIKGIKILDLF
jgi:tetratricopeptide (TPR) repeat protein